MFNREDLKYVDHYSLRDFAAFLEQTAEIIHEKAKQNAFKPEEAQAGAIDHLMRSSRIVIRHLRKGCTLDEALEKTADDIGAPIDSVKRTWRRFCNDKSIYELRRRNRLIIELASFGFTNAQIGRKVNLHPNSVSRIIGAARRDYHLARSGEPPQPEMIDPPKGTFLFD